jgi:hypothetical protein
MNNKKLSDDETKIVADLLSKLEPGFLPFPIFHEVTRLTAMPIIEVVPLRRNDVGKVEILLLQRPSDDPIWPNQLHVPGTVIRALDSFESAFGRIMSKELNNLPTTELKFVKNIIHHSGRGMESSQVYWIEVRAKPTDGHFYDINDLPKTLVKSQMDFIPAAIDDYQKILQSSLAYGSSPTSTSK